MDFKYFNMLYSKEFYEIMDFFEKTSKYLIRIGSQGLRKEPKENWPKQIYYCDGNVNQAFIIFLNGVSFGKTLEDSKQKCYCMNSQIGQVYCDKLCVHGEEFE